MHIAAWRGRRLFGQRVVVRAAMTQQLQCNLFLRRFLSIPPADGSSLSLLSAVDEVTVA